MRLQRKKSFICVFGMLSIPVVSRAAELPHSTSWIGNSFGAKWEGDHGATIKHVQQRVEGAFTTPDGTVFANSFWDEGGSDCGVYKNGDVVGRLEFGAGGWGRDGGEAVTANDQYIFAVMQQRGGVGNSGNPNKLASEPGGKSTWNCIYRFHRAHNGEAIKPAPFPTGVGWNGSMRVINTESTNVAIQGRKYAKRRGARRGHRQEQPFVCQRYDKQPRSGFRR